MLNTLSPAGPLRRAGMLVLRLPSLSEGLYFKITPELPEMPFYLFQWTAEIERHLAEHGVTPDEFEEVVCNPAEIKRSRTTGRPIAIGETSTGKILMCVYEYLDDTTLIPVTAFEPDEE